MRATALGISLTLLASGVCGESSGDAAKQELSTNCCVDSNVCNQNNGIGIGASAYCCPSGGELSYGYTNQATVDCGCGGIPQECTTEPKQQNKVEFKCFDGTVIDLRDVNDDYCDCPDGSDEPLTSACSPRWRFLCSNAEFRPNMIRTSRVDDAICDCCDGSDERRSGVECPNTCAEKRVAHNKLREKRDMVLAAGFARKERLMSSKRPNLEFLRASSREQQDKLDAKKKAVELAEAELEEAKLKERGEKSKLSDAMANGKVEELLQLDKIASKLLSREIARMVLNNGVGGVDQLVKAMKSTSKTGKEFVEREDFDEKTLSTFVQNAQGDTEVESVTFTDDQLDEFVALAGLGTQVTDGLSAILRYVAIATEQVNLMVDIAKEAYRWSHPTSEGQDPQELSEDAVKEALRIVDYNNFALPQIKELESKLAGAREAEDLVRKHLKSNAKLAELDLGPDDSMYLLYEVCVEKVFGEYNYIVCPYDNVKQKNTGLGKYKSIEFFDPSADDIDDDPEKPFFTVAMRFEGGQNCYNVGPRATTLYITCGAENELLEVEEPNTCDYHIKMSSPAACMGPLQVDEHLLKQAQDHEGSIISRATKGITDTIRSVYDKIAGS